MAIYTGYQYRVDVHGYEVIEVDMYSTYTGEVGSLHTLWLESLKLVFQPLQKCIVNQL